MANRVKKVKVRRDERIFYHAKRLAMAAHNVPYLDYETGMCVHCQREDGHTKECWMGKLLRHSRPLWDLTHIPVPPKKARKR